MRTRGAPCAGISGHAEWGEPTDDLTTPFDLSLYVQDADVDGTCALSYSSQLQKTINLPGLSASSSISGWIMQSNFNIDPSPPASGIDWSGASLQFAVRPGVRRVLLCGFQRYVVDDVASYALAVDVVPAACKAGARTVKRGGKLALDCNLSGRLNARFKRNGRTRTLTTLLSTRNGNGTLRIRNLKPGRYRVSFDSDGLELAGTTTIRVRG